MQSWNSESVPRLLLLKAQSIDNIRSLQGQLGSALTAVNWQSPSFGYSNISQNGIEAKDVKASMNDYKRDFHTLERKYAKAFVQEYVDHPWRLRPFAYPTSSGMSAITTALSVLRPKVKNTDVVLMGRSSYFQSKWTAEQLYPGQVMYVDENDTTTILALADTHKPAIVVFDTISNSPKLPVINARYLVPALYSILPSSSTLILDNTCLSTTYQPMLDLPFSPFGMKLLVVESLLKYHQFGLDRVQSGIIWAPAGAHGEIFDARMNLGTVLSDIATQTLPSPNRILLDARLKRMGRNAQLLAELINNALTTTSPVEQVIYPALPSHPSYAWTKTMVFHGSFLTLQFKPLYRRALIYDAFISHVAAQARKQNINLVQGTSFGFDISRIYVAARYASKNGTPFVRIAVGTETEVEIVALANVLIEAISYYALV
jgi:cystathionine beta-lyase/cystathionine gamma-synthase